MRVVWLGWLMGLLMCGTVAHGEDAILRWANGDVLTGWPVSADEGTLTWQSPLFRSPLRMQLPALAAVTFPPAEPAAVATDPFRILLRNGDVLTGTLRAVSENQFSFHSERFGEFSLQRDQVLSIQQGSQAGVIYSGPRGLDGWRVISAPRPVTRAANEGVVMNANPFGAAQPIVRPQAGIKLPSAQPSWIAGSDGTLSSSGSGGSVFLPLQLPDRFEIDFEISTRSRTSFTLSIGPVEKNALQIDTWVDMLVLSQGSSDFAQLMQVAPDSSVLRLRVFVDSPGERISVYSVSGQRLGEMAFKKSWTEPGIGLRRRDTDLTLRRLQVLNWNGVSPRAVNDQQTLVQSRDGQSRLGMITGLDAATGNLQLDVEGAIAEISPSQISSIILAESPDRTPLPPGPAWLSWQDGSLISGKLLSLADGVLRIQPGYASTPLTCRMMGAAAWRLPEVKTASIPADTLIHAGGSLRGTLEVSGEGMPPIRFRPVGSENASALRNGGDARVVRQAAAELKGASVNAAAFPDIISLINNDRFPGRLLAANEQQVLLQTPYAEIRSLSAPQMLAVEFGGTSRLSMARFDVGWEGTGERHDAEALLAPMETLIHPKLSLQEGFGFKVEWPESEVIFLTVEMGQDASPPMLVRVPLVLQSRQVTIIASSVERAQISPAVRVAAPTVNVAGNFAELEFRKTAGVWEVLVDGQLLTSVPGSQTQSDVRGLSFRTRSSSQLSSQRPVPGAMLPAGRKLRIRNLMLKSGGDSLPHLVNLDSQQAALTVPRFRREFPPTHLLIAPTGELLRGRLLELDRDAVKFEVGTELLRLERDRVAAMVWLRETPAAVVADEKPATANAGQEDEMQALLADGTKLTMAPTELIAGQVLGSSRVLGQCRIPADSIRELTLGNPAHAGVVSAFQDWVLRRSPEPKWDVASPSESGANELLGTVAAEFELPMLDGTTFRVRDHQDKIIVLDFWASWCGPCVMALPEYESVFAEYDSSKVLFVAVNLQEAPDLVRKFLNDHHFQLRVGLDHQGELGRQFKVSGIPHTVIMNRGNVIEDVHVGFVPGTGDSLKAAVDAMLAGTWTRQPKAAETSPVP